jgi:elongation factor P
MNPESFEQVTASPDVLGDAAAYLQEGMTISLSTHNDVPIAMSLPRTATLEIVETEPSVKGQTASSSYKPALLSNGVKTTVPPYLGVGARIIVLTEDGSYQERAKD